MSYKILITDDLSVEGLAYLDAAEDVSYDVVQGLTPESLARHIPDYDGLIVRSSVTVTKDVLAAATRLKVVGRAGVGVDNIDIEAASEGGVIVMNTPGANTIATSEHTLALMMALVRHIPQAYSRLKAGEWDRKRFTGTQLYRKTIGIVGMGRIGSRVAKRCQAFEMKVLAYDPYMSDDVAREIKVHPVTMDELLEQSDFIALHAALTPQTTGLINAEAIERMKPGVRIINTARGPLINETALLDGLRSGKVAGAALDVFAAEPLAADHPLLELENVIVTPHLAASTTEAQNDVGTQVILQMLDALRDIDFRNAVNMPFADAALLRQMQPYLGLAEKVGSLQAQLADHRVTRIEVEIKGEEIADHIKPITVGILKGFLDPVLHRTVNYINAPHLARRHGITLSQSSGLPTLDYPNLITCRIEWEGGGDRTVVATLFNDLEPRLVQIDGYRVDVRPEGNILVTQSHDRPGFIGQVGTVLGAYNINIATWRTGRNAPGGVAISFISVDSDISPEIMNTIRSIDLIEAAKIIRL
jgi:D-3-phosphoglycerate dehydrogenase